jgi:hypothetical protein
MVAFSFHSLLPRFVFTFIGCGMFFDCTALTVMHDTTPSKSAATSSCIVDGKSRRIAWLHIPKTGSSFANSIARYLRPDFPEDALVPDCRKDKCEHTDNPSEGNVEFQYLYPTSTWFPDCVWLKDGHGPNNLDWFAHHQLHKSFWLEWQGSFVGIFREPAQRAISSWNDFAQVAEQGLGKVLNQEQWARHIEGTATKMLAGQEFPIEVQFYHRNESLVVPDVEMAISRLSGFLFVGVMKHWGLSMCLFHTITASTCSRQEMSNSRKNGNRGVEEEWSVSELNGYVDPYDNKLYQAVTDRFWKDVREQNLTKEKCHRTCPSFDPDSFDLWY